MQHKFSVGDEVQWSSQSSGYEKKKIGTVAFVVPANVPVWSETVMGYDSKKQFDLKFDFSGRRSEESYLVSVPGKTANSRPLLYWPRTKHLEKIG